MNTMYRCLFVAIATAALVAPAAAQMQRQFPATALRGALVVGTSEIRINGRTAQFAPGVRVRDQNNMIQLSGALVGQKLRVNYTIDTSGLVKDVWILRPDEEAMWPWPTTPEQAQAWSFDPGAQVWTKP
jgi:opacity protein-like surface antigen